MNSTPALVLALALAGCALPDEGDEPEIGETPDAIEPTRAIALGDLSEDGVLVPWQDGQLVEVVLGFQGFEMITFYIEAAIEPGDPDAESWCVRTSFAEDPSDPLAGAGVHCQGVDAEIVDARVRFGPVLRILTTKDVRGEPLALAVEVSTDTFTSVEIRTIELF